MQMSVNESFTEVQYVGPKMTELYACLKLFTNPNVQWRLYTPSETFNTML